MRFLLLSDLHATEKIPVARTDNILKTFDGKFTYVLDYAAMNGIHAILQAGDLSDHSRSWVILNYFLTKLQESQIMFYTVFGQHDMYLRSHPMRTPSTMLALIKSGVISPLSAYPVTINDVNIFGAHWGEKIPPATYGEKNILVLHAPIAMKAEWTDQKFTHPSHFLTKYEAYDLVLVGDIHRKFKVKHHGRYVVNTGPILRLDASEYNLIHKPIFYVYDTEEMSIETVEIPHEPADKVLTRDHIDKKKLSKQELEAFADSLKNLKPLANIRQDWIVRYMKSHIANKRVKRIIMETINGK